VGALVLFAVACAATAQAAEEPVTRDCATSVYGELGDWQRDSVVLGPLGFVRARGYASAFVPLPAGGGRYRGSKLLVVVRTGWVVRLVVPVAQRRKVALQYDSADFNKAVVPAEGEHDVTFEACRPGRPLVGPATSRWTQFNGAIVLARRRCVRLDVYAAKRGRSLPSEPQRVRLSFGAGACRA
jgi:hypothetical protein